MYTYSQMGKIAVCMTFIDSLGDWLVMLTLLLNDNIDEICVVGFWSAIAKCLQ